MEQWTPTNTAEADRESRERHSGEARKEPFHIVTLQTAQALPTARSHNSTRFYSRLKRACRIALLEGEQSGTAEDIYARIVRRESLSIADRQGGVASILAALTFMASDAEVRCIDAGAHKTWQLNPPPECQREPVEVPGTPVQPDHY